MRLIFRCNFDISSLFFLLLKTNSELLISHVDLCCCFGRITKWELCGPMHHLSSFCQAFIFHWTFKIKYSFFFCTHLFSNTTCSGWKEPPPKPPPRGPPHPQPHCHPAMNPPVNHEQITLQQKQVTLHQEQILHTGNQKVIADHIMLCKTQH